MRDRVAVLAPLLPLAWFAVAFLVVRPLTNGPVVDSWIYLRAVKNLRAGVLALPGFTAALPFAQIVYGTLWSFLFGLNYVSLDCSVAVLGVAGAMLFYGLARRCNAGREGAMLATSLLIANPCYLFLSFSFMTDVPFVTALIAGHLLFAMAQQGRVGRRLWISALLLMVAFLVRPFALAAMVGSAGTLLLAHRPGRKWPGLVLPFAAAAALSGLVWLWLTALRPAPWMLDLRAGKLNYLYLVPVRVYFTDALLAPLLYLGLVLSPLALPRLFSLRWRLGLAIAAGLAAVAIPTLLTDPGANSIPELSCCGLWSNVLVLWGPLRFVWTDQALRVAVLALSILGTAGVALAALEVSASSLGFVAVMISAAAYWGGIIPLWLFNDRYYLVMVPAGCLLLAVAPPPPGLAARTASLALLALLGGCAIAGVYEQQRGLRAVIAARDTLIRQGVARSAIDAGYPLNGNDLYRDPQPGQRETFETEAGIPLITSLELKEYTIAAAPISGTAIIKRIEWPGVWGLGRRQLYLLKIAAGAQSPAAPSYATGVKPGALPRQADLSAHPPLLVILARLIAMVMLMLAPLGGVLAALGIALSRQSLSALPPTH